MCKAAEYISAPNILQYCVFGMDLRQTAVTHKGNVMQSLMGYNKVKGEKKINSKKAGGCRFSFKPNYIIKRLIHEFL